MPHMQKIKFIVVLIFFVTLRGEGGLTKCHNDVKHDQNLFVNTS